jgi:hypothetical protein
MYGEFREMINLQKNKKSYYCTYEKIIQEEKLQNNWGLIVPRSENTSMNTRKKEKLLQEDMEVDTGELIQSIVEKPKYKIGTRKNES